MKPKNDARPDSSATDNRPYVVCGSGPLVSFVWKDGDDRTEHRYGFNVFRANRQTGEVSQLFGPADVEHLAKLAKLLGLRTGRRRLSAGRAARRPGLPGVLPRVTCSVRRPPAASAANGSGGRHQALTPAPGRRMFFVARVAFPHDQLGLRRHRTHMKRQPLHQIRRGLIVARIWRKRTRAGARYCVTVVRLFRNDGAWKESTRFQRDDIPLLRLVLDEAHTWIYMSAPRV